MASLESAVAVITGSTSGIGRAIAVRLHAAGARVVLNSRRSAEEGRRLEEELAGSTYVQADVADRAGAAILVRAALERWGRLDVVVNNAGTTRRIAHGDLEAATDDVWHDMLTANVLGAWHMVQEAVPTMRRAGGGRILNISSMAGVDPMGSSIPYAAAKAALNHTTALLARTLGPDITVNAVAPGLTDTPWTSGWAEDRRHVSEVAPLGRIAVPDDVARACLSLLTQDYVTGVVMPVDGGMHLL